MLVAAFVLAVKVAEAPWKGIRWDLAGAMMVETLIENSFQAVRAVDAV